MMTTEATTIPAPTTADTAAWLHGSADRWWADAQRMRRAGDPLWAPYQQLAGELRAAAREVNDYQSAVLARVRLDLDSAERWAKTELITDDGFAQQCALDVVAAARAALDGDGEDRS